MTCLTRNKTHIMTCLRSLVFFLATPILVNAGTSDHCTAMAIDPRATVNGAGIATTSADGSPLDFRLVWVPSAEHAPGSTRPVYIQSEPYPRLAVKERGPDYVPQEGQTEMTPLGYIPQVERTLGYWDTNYGVLNEAGVAMGESSCSGKIAATPVGVDGGQALFWVGELTRVALERCSSARCAVQLMGDLAFKYGYYATTGVTEAGEAITVADSSEAFVFHVMADPTGKHAIWAAQRVPDGEVAVVANMFTIRYIDPANTRDFLFSPNIFDVAARYGWWDPAKGDLLDFTAAFSVGEYDHPHYSGRRLWRAFSLFAPSLGLDPEIGVFAKKKTYPFSVKPDAKVTPQFVFSVYRDHLEGTQFDLTKGLAAGPFGTPNRYAEAATEKSIPYGAWERAISLYRTMYAYVVESKEAVAGPDSTGIVHMCPGVPHASVFVPVPTGPFTRGSVGVLGRGWQGKVDQGSLWWASTSVFNIMDLKYRFMKPQVQKIQSALENKWAAQLSSDSASAFGESAAATEALAAYWELFWSLLGEWQNGYAAWGYSKVGYNNSGWLHAVGYTDFRAPKERFDQQKRDFAAAQKTADEIRKHSLGASEEAPSFPANVGSHPELQQLAYEIL